MLPEIIDALGGGKFDIKLEFMVSGILIVGCLMVGLYAHIFLDDDLRPKKEPLAFIPRFFGWEAKPKRT